MCFFPSKAKNCEKKLWSAASLCCGVSKSLTDRLLCSAMTATTTLPKDYPWMCLVTHRSELRAVSELSSNAKCDDANGNYHVCRTSTSCDCEEWLDPTDDFFLFSFLFFLYFIFITSHSSILFRVSLHFHWTLSAKTAPHGEEARRWCFAYFVALVERSAALSSVEWTKYDVKDSRIHGDAWVQWVCNWRSSGGGIALHILWNLNVPLHDGHLTWIGMVSGVLHVLCLYSETATKFTALQEKDDHHLEFDRRSDVIHYLVCIELGHKKRKCSIVVSRCFSVFPIPLRFLLDRGCWKT